MRRALLLACALTSSSSPDIPDMNNLGEWIAAFTLPIASSLLEKVIKTIIIHDLLHNVLVNYNFWELCSKCWVENNELCL